MMIVGDIGGTHTRLALFDKNDYTPKHLHIFPSPDFSDLESIIEKYLKEVNAKVDVGCFAIAGPIIDETCRVTNLPWMVEAKKIKKRFLLSHVYLLNDLEANAYAIEVLPQGNIREIFTPKGDKKFGNQCVISPGTGLGEACLYWDGERHYPFASEGGHSDFAPTDDKQVELLQFLRARYGHVSYERILSGPGLINIYQFLTQKLKREREPNIEKEKDPSPLISEYGLERKSQVCEEALDLFVQVFGQEVGNCALKFMAFNGIFLGGGIVPRIYSKLKESIFMESYLSKGDFRSLLEQIPIYAILDDHAALLGAAHYGILSCS